MSGLASAIYEGPVTHARFRPRRHSLRYSIFMLLLDLDELAELDEANRLFAVNGTGLLAFRERDHGDGSGDLKAWVRARLADAGMVADGPVRILCMPRVLGAVFNPISVYFCHAADGALAAVLYEVNNTFGQRHSYLVAIGDGQGMAHGCDKAFYVSPFMDMDLRYDFQIAAPADAFRLGIHVSDETGLKLTAAFSASRRPFTDSELLGVWLRHPLLTLKVVGGIHWEALKLFLKGVRLTRRPPAPAHPVTVVRPAVATPRLSVSRIV